LMEALGIAHLAARPLDSYTLATQQRTEIARALARAARVFLFDEPNSALTDEESDQLFREMRALAEAGRIVILVTHRLGDLVEHTRRVAVIRDGRVTAELEGAALNEDAIAQQLVLGERRAAEEDDRPGQPAVSRAGGRLFEVEGWSHRDGKFEALALTV